MSDPHPMHLEVFLRYDFYGREVWETAPDDLDLIPEIVDLALAFISINDEDQAGLCGLHLLD